MATRFGRSRKQRLGTAEKGDGRRASQVLANLGVASVAAVLFAIYGRAGFSLAMGGRAVRSGGGYGFRVRSGRRWERIHV